MATGADHSANRTCRAVAETVLRFNSKLSFWLGFFLITPEMDAVDLKPGNIDL